MKRLKSLDPPHKGLRNALSKLALLTGKTNYTDFTEVKILQSVADEVFHLLKDHTATENKFILAPLEARMPGSTEDYLADHSEIESWENELISSFKQLDGTQSNDQGHLLYLELCDFQSLYLEHIDVEDADLEELMQENFTDEELMAHQIEIMKEMSFETLLLWFKYIVPARRAEENAQVLTGFKSAAPEAAFKAVLQTISTEIGEVELNKILALVQ